MSDRPTSPTFVGRTEQLAVLDEALDRVTGGTAATVLVGGEAGVGKSRLAAEFAARSGDRTATHPQVLAGGCLELGVEGLPFAPFTAALRQVVKELGAGEVAGLLPGGPGELARLLPELGGAPPETEGSRLRLFEHVRVVLGGLAERRPLVLVVEDAHWADRSTRDLMTFLVHNLDSGVLLVVTYRSDELTRTHPLRPLLAELDRTDRVTRVELTRLSRGEVREQLAGILGHPPDPALVEQVYARSAGNPLFVESLVGSDGTLRAGLSDSLRDLLLAGVRRLPEQTQQVLRAAACAGGRVDHPLLAAVTGLEGVTLDEMVRPAVDGRVLVPDEHGYAFRHALIREALDGDLLPGERTRLHMRYAEALERTARPDAGCTVELAHHWYTAHDAPKALTAAWCAAAAARSALAYAEQLDMLERVLELWDRVPDAAERVGSDNLGVLELAVAAARATGEVNRGVTYADAVLGEVDEERSPVRAARVLEMRGRMLRSQGREKGTDDLRRAAKLVPAEPPSADRASVLAALAHAVHLEPNVDEAEALGAEALAVARAVGDPVTEADALTTLACVHAVGGLDETLEMLGEVRAIAHRVGEPMISLRADITESDSYENAGLHDKAAEVARRGLADAHASGLARTAGALLACNLAEALDSLGRWDEAMEVAQAALDLRPAPVNQALLMTRQGFIALARGDNAFAGGIVRAVRAVYSTCYVSAQDQLPPARLDATVLLAEGRPYEALEAIERALATYRIEITRSPRYAWPLLAVGAQACAACVDARASDADAAARVAAVLTDLRAVATGLAASGPVQSAQRATFAAAAADAAAGSAGSTDDAGSRGDWVAAVSAWDATDQPYPRAQTLLRAAAAAAAAGDRDALADQLRRSAEIADRLGAAPLRRGVDDLARRSRINLRGPAAPTDVEPYGLTPREVEVLRLVAAGHSNRHIAEELFISVKTASVHVSNILAKLGVASRGEAAAAAHRTGLLLDEPAPH